MEKAKAVGAYLLVGSHIGAVFGGFMRHIGIWFVAAAHACPSGIVGVSGPVNS